MPWIVIGSGAAITIAGGVMAYRARANENKIEDAMSGVEAQTFHDRARRAALAANILFGVGAGVVITGLVLAW